jgi:spermidine synthase
MNVYPLQSKPNISGGSNSLNYRGCYQQGLCRLITFIGCFLSLFSSPALEGKEQVVKEHLSGDKWYQAFVTSKILYKGKTPFQRIAIFENQDFGRILTLDEVVQLTQKDEPHYHEMIVHVPFLSHGNVHSVLIIGGGDGGTLREVFRYDTVEKAVMVELDGQVVEICKKYLPTLSNGAFYDPRLELHIQDGIEFVKNTNQRFDVIIIDSTDPAGPSEVLFTKEFYKNCKRILNNGGIVVAQNGPTFDDDVACLKGFRNLAPNFQYARIYLSVVPAYLGGQMCFSFATDAPDYFNISEEELETRLKSLGGEMKYYTSAVHKASFALPQYVLNAMKK